MRKVLILTAGFGNGHNVAAFNLRDALLQNSTDVQAEVIDLIRVCYGARCDIVKALFLGVVNHMPRLWTLAYRTIDRTSVVDRLLRHLHKMRRELSHVIASFCPDVVISTYPAYNFVLDRISEADRARGFLKMTVVTDSISLNAIWHKSPSDYYFVANEASALVLQKAGVPRDKIFNCGFPVSPWFYELAQTQLTPMVTSTEPRRVLYMTHQGKCTAGSVIERLLQIPDLEMTIVCGNQPALQRSLVRRTASLRHRVRVLGWTNRIPELLASSHLVISKAGGAVVQEAIAARCPIIINRIISGHEEGNARLVTDEQIGDVTHSDDELVGLVRRAFSGDASIWHGWKTAISRQSRPGAALNVAQTILEKISELESCVHSLPAVGSELEQERYSDFPLMLRPRKQMS